MRAYCRTHLADRDLARLLAERVAQDFATTAALLADLAEFDARKLYLPAAHPSLLSYCTEVLHLSKDSALRRIQAARAARDFPILFDAVAQGRLHLTGVCLLAPHLTSQNAEEFLKATEHRSKAEIERFLAERFPRSEVLPMVQPLPAAPLPNGRAGGNGGKETGASYAPAHTPAPVCAKVTPLSGRSYELRFSIADQTHDKLCRAQDLLSHELSPGDLAALFDRALDCLIARVEKQKFAATDRPSRTPRPTRSRRHIPAEVKRAVRERDGGRCTFVSETGERCPARGGLQFDHIEPIARGGVATVANVRLLCAAHNAYAAERIFGKGFMDGKARRSAAAPGLEARAASAPVHAADGGAPPAAEAGAHAEAPDDLEEQELDVIAALRGLGVRAERARHVAEHCMKIPEVTFEERLRFALRALRPPCSPPTVHGSSVHCG